MSSYMTRAMQAKDPRFANILDILGHKRPTAEAQQQSAPDEDIASLRSEYEAAVGKRPFMGWGADKLREKIAEAALNKAPGEQSAIADADLEADD